MSIKEIFKLVFGWRVLILLFAVIAIYTIPLRERFTYQNSSIGPNNIFSMWANFDGGHYLDLAQYGYGYQHKTDMDYAFFPIYPWLIKSFNFFNSYLFSGLFLSHLALILSLYFLYKLILFDENAKIAKSAIQFLIIFPTAFFFGSVYTESVFLLLSVLSFYFARKNNFFLSSVFAGIASATRLAGIFIFPAIVYEYWLANDKNLKKALNPSIVWLSIAPLGLLSFMKFQVIKVNDPLFFVNLQSNFAQRTTDKLILLYQVFFRYFKMLIFVDHTDPLFFTVMLEFLSACLLVFILIFFIKKMRFSYWIYCLLSFLVPSLTGTFMSLPRFVLVLFPVFIFLSKWFSNMPKIYTKIYFILCIIFTLISVVLFTRGYFVA